MTEMLKFVARADFLVRVPKAVQFIGQPAVYVNRNKKSFADGSWGYPASETPYQAEVGSQEAARLIRIVQREGALWPYDELTANACGTKFVAVECVDGEWVPVTKPSAKPKKVANEG